MSAVLKFPQNPAEFRQQQREASVVSEVIRVAAGKGYQSRSAVEAFKRDALRLAAQRPGLEPTTCASKCVPERVAGLGDVWGDLPPGAA